MDDFPAGPASPGPRRPPLSVVIPVHNGGRDLRALPPAASRLRGRRADYELIVVDDGSTDGSAALGRVVRRRRRPQPGIARPAAARNAGARGATAPLVFFLDADVAVHPDTLARALARFEADPGLVGLFGSYDDAPDAPGLVSQFRNLLHHFVHQQGEFARRRPPRPDLLDRLRGDPPRRLPRPRRLRPRALPPARDRGHRARLPPDPRRAPDRPGAGRPGDPPEALDARRRGPDRHLPARASPGCS